MRYDWLDAYLMSKKGVAKDFKAEWNWIRYQIGGKLFTALCLDSNDSPKYITLKLEPADGANMRTYYPGTI